MPSRADELLAAGDELSLREAAELEPRRADIAVALAKARLARGAEEEALEAVEGFPDDFAAAGIAARVQLAEAGVAPEAWTALDAATATAAMDALLDALAAPDGDATNGDGEGRRSTPMPAATSSAAPRSASSPSSIPPIRSPVTTGASFPPPSRRPAPDRKLRTPEGNICSPG